MEKNDKYTTISLLRSTKEKLEKLKIIPDETYDHLIHRLTKKKKKKIW